MDTPNAIEAEDLCRRFGSRLAVDHVSFQVRRGESVVVFGPNGAGKTTLLRILASTLQARPGTVRVEGHEYNKEPRRIRSMIGVISHDSYLYADLSARENLVFFARLYGVKDPGAAADRMLAAMELSTRADDPAKALSRGMTQRLAVARSLVHDPRVVFLDEPFSGLDPHAAAVLRDALTRLRSEGRTLMMVTHNIPLGLRMSDRWLLMDRGRLVEQGDSAGQDSTVFEEMHFRREAARP